MTAVESLCEGREEDESHEADDRQVKFGLPQLVHIVALEEGKDHLLNLLGDECLRDVKVGSDLGIEDEFDDSFVGDTLLKAA